MPSLTKPVALVSALITGLISPAFSQEKPVIKIAISTPLSGPLGPSGKVQLIAVKLGVDDINASGGINGSKVELLTYDDQFDPAQGVLRVREAYAAGALALIGPYGSTQWETVVPMLNQMKMPAINASATKSGINTPPYAMRLSQPDERGMPQAFDEFMKAFPNIKKVAVVGDVREASGKAAVDRWVRLAKEHGLQVAGELTYTGAQTDLSGLAIRAKGLGVDGLLVGMLPAEAIKFATELHVQGLAVPVLANAMVYSGAFPQTISQTVGADASKWHVVGFSNNESGTGTDQEAYRKFVERFVADVNKDPALAQFQPPNVANSNLGYDAVTLIASLLRKQGVDGSTPVAEAREKLRQAMSTVKDYQGLNSFTFDDKADGAPPARLLRVEPSRKMYVLVKD